MEDCPGEVAPKHVFVARTHKNTTAQIVENCLEYLSGIKGKAVCVTREDLLESAFSLSWRVQIDAKDPPKALESSSWKEGWTVREYIFYKKKKDESNDDVQFSSHKNSRNNRPLYK